MKRSAAVFATVLALLLAGAAEAQTKAQTMPSGSPGGVSRLPSHVRPPFFFRRPFFFGSGLILTTPAVAAPQTYVYSYAYPVHVQNPVYGQPQAQYWAYCRSPQGYYPYVSECPAGWRLVAPTSPPPPLVPGQTSLDAGQPPKESPTGGDSIEEIRLRIARSRAD